MRFTYDLNFIIYNYRSLPLWNKHYSPLNITTEHARYPSLNPNGTEIFQLRILMLGIHSKLAKPNEELLKCE